MAGNRRLLEQFDWSATPLGPRNQWPPSMQAVLRMAMDSGFPVAFAWGDEAIQIYNDAYIPIYGNKHPQAFGRPMHESWPEIWPFLKPAFDQVMATGEPLWFHESLLPLARHGTPEECWFDYSYSPVRDETGRALGMVSIAVEKTEEVVLRRRHKCCDLPLGLVHEGGMPALSETLREHLAENAMDAAAARFTQWDESEPPCPVEQWAFGNPDDQEGNPRWATLGFCDSRGRPLAQLELLPSPLVPPDSHARFLRILSDRVERILHHAERVDRAKRELDQQDKLYQFLFENIGEAATYSTTDGGRESEEIILAANPAAARLLGYSVEELVGMKREQLFFPEYQALGEALAVRETQRSFSGELIFRRKDGQPVQVEVSSRLVRTNDGEYRAISLLRDASARAAREAERAAQSRFEAIAQLTGGMAHDFNNLLTVVLGSLEMLLEDLPPGGRAASYARNALLCAERGASLTNQLLSYGRRQPLRLQPVDLEAHLEELQPLVRSSLGEINQLVVERHGGLPRCASDLSQLTTAMLNLAVNARDAMPAGGRLRLSADAVTVCADGLAPGGVGLAPGRYVRLVVEDSGRGIPEELHERIFEPYFTTKGVGAGSGLGLAMVKGFVQQCGGEVQVQSAPGEGARFELYFPEHEAEPESKCAETPAADPSGLTLLVVEDNDLVRAQVCGLLVGAGFTVRQAGQAREALDSIATLGPPDLVLTDLVMPGGMSGMQLAHALRRDHPGLPVLVMTGHDPWAASRDDADRQFEVLAKPFDRATLLAALNRQLAAAAAPSGARRQNCKP